MENCEQNLQQEGQVRVMRIRGKDRIGLFAFMGVVYSVCYTQERLSDNFDNGLSAWSLMGAQAIKIIASGDAAHGDVLQLTSDNIVYALVKNSDSWGSVRVEGDVLFPDDGDSYLGLVYNYKKGKFRTDFGEIYIKGNGSYLQVNPWYDGNASRLLYNEYTTQLSGPDSIVIKTWVHFRAEISENICHFYAGNMNVPKMVFDAIDMHSGLVGFHPRVAGGSVWIDNIRISSIERLTYQGPAIPSFDYEPDQLITQWEVIGPLPGLLDAIGHTHDATARQIEIGKNVYEWKPFQTDKRGAVVTARVTEYLGTRPVAYFRTRLYSDSSRTAELHVTTVDELGLYINGHFEGFIYRDGYVSGSNDWNAWYDFWRNPSHAGRKISVTLKKGMNQIVVCVRNGQFASGGFFARIE